MSTALTPTEAIRQAVKIVGSQSELARICGVSQPAVWKWLQTAKRVPAEQVLAIETATGVSRHFLRPDIYPYETPCALASFQGVIHPVRHVSFDRSKTLQGGAA